MSKDFTMSFNFTDAAAAGIIQTSLIIHNS